MNLVDKVNSYYALEHVGKVVFVINGMIQPNLKDLTHAAQLVVDRPEVDLGDLTGRVLVGEDALVVLTTVPKLSQPSKEIEEPKIDTEWLMVLDILQHLNLGNSSSSSALVYRDSSGSLNNILWGYGETSNTTVEPTLAINIAYLLASYPNKLLMQADGHTLTVVDVVENKLLFTLHRDGRVSSSNLNWKKDFLNIENPEEV